MTEHADVAIVGGGPVGSALAVKLSLTGLNVALIEARESAPTHDVRPLALSYGSRLIFERLGVWSALSPATSIERIHVSQRGAFGRTVMTAREAGLPALGYVVDYAGLVRAFDAAIAMSSVNAIRGARVERIDNEGERARVSWTSGMSTGACDAALVVVADGNAASAAIPVRTRDYGQTAITARVRTEKAHEQTAYERFTREGPLALLPFENSYALVWTSLPQTASMLCDLDDNAFLAQLQERFGDRVGRFVSITSRAQHRLVLKVASTLTRERIVLIGNAAQSLHPVAGQGFNLGLRDAWELGESIASYGVDDARVLERYRARRRIDRRGGIAFTDTLVRLFSNESVPLELARASGLTLLDCVPRAKDFVMRRMIFGARG